MRNRFQGESRTKDSYVTLQGVSFLTAISVLVGMLVAYSVDLSDVGTTTNSQTASYTPRYAVIDLDANKVPISLNNNGDVVGSNFGQFFVWHQGVSTTLSTNAPSVIFQYDYYTVSSPFYTYTTTVLNFDPTITKVNDINDSGVIIGGQSESLSLGSGPGSSYAINPYLFGLPVYWANSTASPTMMSSPFSTVSGPVDETLISGYFFQGIQISNSGAINETQGNNGGGLYWTSPTAAWSSSITVPGVGPVSVQCINRMGDMAVYWQTTAPGVIYQHQGVYDHLGTLTQLSTILYPIAITDYAPYVYLDYISPSHNAIYDGTNFVPGLDNNISVASPSDTTKVQVIGVSGGSPALLEKQIPAGSPVGTAPTWITKAISLNSLIPQNSGWILSTVARINDSGAIVGTATYLGTNTAIASGSHGVMLCPCAVVSDPSDTYTVDITNPVLNYVRFGLWDHAFDSSGNVLNGNGESGNFVGSDTRRFYIRVYDPSATTSTVTVDWYTQTSTGTVDDDGKGPSHTGVDTITLTRSSSNPAVYVSKALMLVADEVDNAQVTNTGLSGGGNAAEGAADHRLRRAALGDTMCYAYTPAAANQTKSTFTVPLFGPAGSPDAVKQMAIQILNFSDKTRIGNRNIDPTTSDVITAAESALIARYAICGIKVNITYNPTADVINETTPAAPNLNSIGQFAFSTPGNYQTLSPSDDMVALMNEPSVVSRHFDSNTIIVIFIGGFAGGGNTGESFPDGWISASPTSIQKNTVWISNSAGNALTPCHEVGHIVTNATLTADEASGSAVGWAPGGHYGGTPDYMQNLMYANITDTSVSGKKRLWDDTSIHHVQQITRIRSTHYITP